MEFTEAEAKAKVGKQVRAGDDSLWRVRITRGTRGEVIGTQLYHSEGEGGKVSSWVVSLRFALARDGSVSVVLRDVDKAQYVGCFEEIPAEKELEKRDGLERTHFKR